MTQITSKQIEANKNNTAEIIILNHDAGTEILASTEEMVAVFTELFRGDWRETEDPRVLAILVYHDVITRAEVDGMEEAHDRYGESGSVDISGVSDEVMNEIIMVNLYDNDSGVQTVDHHIGDFSTMTIAEWLHGDSDCDPDGDEWSDAALALLVTPKRKCTPARYYILTRSAWASDQDKPAAGPFASRGDAQAEAYHIETDNLDSNGFIDTMRSITATIKTHTECVQIFGSDFLEYLAQNQIEAQQEADYLSDLEAEARA